jgi:hypothetical protein
MTGGWGGAQAAEYLPSKPEAEFKPQYSQERGGEGRERKEKNRGKERGRERERKTI